MILVKVNYARQIYTLVLEIFSDDNSAIEDKLFMPSSVTLQPPISNSFSREHSVFKHSSTESVNMLQSAIYKALR